MTSSRGCPASRPPEERCSWECVRISHSAWTNCSGGIRRGSNLFVRDQNGAFWLHRRTKMTSLTSNYLDGNAAAGELSRIFAMDLTAAEGQCAHCGARKRFADAHVYMQSPGVVARCAVCQHVLLRLVSVRQRVFLDLRGMTYLCLDTDHVQPSESARSAS